MALFSKAEWKLVVEVHRPGAENTVPAGLLVEGPCPRLLTRPGAAGGGGGLSSVQEAPPRSPRLGWGPGWPVVPK